MRTTTFSVLDYLPAPVREFPKRRAAELAGLAVLSAVTGLGLALLTWSVSDPSLNHATNAPVHNLLGKPGAIASDIAMQLLGLGCIAALPPPAFWGWAFLTGRRLESLRVKAGLYLAGVAAAAALASLLPAPGSWPLPSGLGGVVGDALLAAPRRLFSGARWGMAATGAAYATVAILALTGASGVGFRRAHRGQDRPPKKAGDLRAKPRYDEPEGEDEPGFAMVSIGAAIHAALTAKAMVRRMFWRRPKRSARASPPGGAAAARGAVRAPWIDLKADDDALTEPGAYAPRTKAEAPAQPTPALTASRVASAAGPLKPGPRAAAVRPFRPRRRSATVAAPDPSPRPP